MKIGELWEVVMANPAQRLSTTLTVRPMTREDIAGYVRYICELSAQDIARMGLDPERIPSPQALHEDLEIQRTTPLEQAKAYTLVWQVDGEPIGHTSLKDIVHGEHGGMHLHMWRADLRGKGYGPKLFCMAAVEFYERLRLDSIVCEPKSTNPMPNGLLRKVGFPLVRTYIGRSSDLSAVTELNRYEIKRDIAELYLARTCS